MFSSTNRNIFIFSLLIGIFIFSLLFSKPLEAYILKSFAVSNNNVSSSIWTSCDFTTPIKAANCIGSYMVAKKGASLYESMVVDMKKTFTRYDFSQSLAGTNVKSYELLSQTPVYLSSTQAQVLMRLTYLDNSSSDFKVILNKESNNWRLLGTVSLE